MQDIRFDETYEPLLTAEEEAVLAASLMKYRGEYRLLICTVCNEALGASFARHYLKKHNRRMNAETRNIATRLLVDSPYLQRGQPLLDPVDFRPIEDGFKCANCEFYSVELNTIQKHTKTHEPRCEFMPCSVQRVNDWSRTPYFGVLLVPGEPVPIINEQNRNDTENQGPDAVVLMNAFRGSIQLVVEQGRKLGLFYQLSGFVTEGAVDPFQNVDKDFYIRAPIEDDDEKVWLDFLSGEILDFFNDLNLRDVQLRYAVSPGKRPLKRLETTQSRNEYAVVMIRFLRFLMLLVEHRLTEVQFPESLLNAINEFIYQGDFDNACQLVLAVLKVDPRICLPADPLSLFVRFCCTKDNGDYMKAANIERLIAKLFYMARVSIVHQVSSLPPSEQTVALNQLSQLVKVGTANTFSNVVLLKSIAHAEVLSTPRPPLLIQGSNEMEVKIAGLPISANDVRNVFLRSLEKCRELQLKLLLEARVPNIQPFDDLSDETPLKGILASSDLRDHGRVEALLLQHILDNAELKSRYVLGIDGNEIRFNSNVISEYLKTYDEFISNLLILIHIGSGMPARATELTSLTRVNGCTALRGLYFSHGMIFTMTVYNKTRGLKALNTSIARFVSEDVTRLLLVDDLIVRPFVALAAAQIGANEDNTYTMDVFVIKGKPMSPEQARNIFRTLFSTYSGTHLTFGQYRHVAKYFSRVVGIEMPLYPDSRDEDDPLDDLDEDIFELNPSQFGHSRLVSDQSYAIVAGEHSRLRAHNLVKFRTMSCKWHGFLSNHGRTDTQRRHQATMVVTDTGFDHVNQPVAMLNRGNETVIEDGDNNALYVDLNLEPLPVRVRRDADNRVELQNTFFLPLKPRHDVLLLLRHLFKSDDIEFRSQEQELAAEYICNSSMNLLVILPTGVGKSTLVFLSCLAENRSSVIMVVPTISLRQDIQNRAMELGISTCISMEEYSLQSLILLTPESAASAATIRVIFQAVSAKKIVRIFIDEAHMVSTDSSWRTSLKDLVHLGILGIPMVLLTGTCPPYVSKEICEMFFSGPSQPLIVRARTNRPNIQYGVRRFTTGSESRLIADYLAGLKNFGDKCIVYVTSRDEAVSLAFALTSLGFHSAPYHAQLSLQERAANFLSWKESRISAIVATSAFGVGIDDLHVRLVIMIGLPYSMLDYLQQSGRAGRDNQPAQAWILYDIIREKRRIEAQTIASERELLSEMLFYVTLSNICRRRVLSRYIDGHEVSCTDYGDMELCDLCSKICSQTQAPANEPPVLAIGATQLPVLASGSKHVAQVGILSRNTMMAEVITLLDNLDEYCGACLAAKRGLKRHGQNQICDLKSRKCDCCYQTGHYAARCPDREVHITGGHVCFGCFRPVEDGVHGSEVGASCTKGRVMKDFYRFASSNGVIHGITKGRLDIPQFCSIFVTFCRHYL